MRNLICITCIILAALLGSCSPKVHYQPTFSQALLPYSQIYLTECEHRYRERGACDISEIGIVLGPITRPGILGYCQQIGLGSGFSYRNIVINQDTFFQMSESSKEALVIHEYGHCHLGLDHSDEGHAPGPVPSIMSTYLMDGDFYAAHREQLLNDLFRAPRLP